MIQWIKNLLKPLTITEAKQERYYKDYVITITWSDGTIVKYQGGGTVWHLLPMMKRCTTSWEYRLTEIHHYLERWGNSYPTAHLSKES